MTNMLKKSQSIKDFTQIPGVGKSIAQDLLDLGFTSTEQLKGQDAEILYRKLEDLAQKKICRCMLYVFRCAIYYATEEDPEEEKLNWWFWKD